MSTLLMILLLPGQTVESKDFSHEKQQAAALATVRIVNKTRSINGSGAIIKRSGPFVYVLTASHVVDQAEQLEVHTFSAQSYPKPANTYGTAQVLAQAKTEDLALVRFATRDPVPGTLPLCTPDRVPGDQGFRGLTVGCTAGQAPTCLVEEVTGKKRVQKRGQEGTAYFWEMKQEPAQGRSGGPLIDPAGYLVGVTSLAGDGKGYCCHTTEIHRFLKQNGVKWLYEEER